MRAESTSPRPRPGTRQRTRRMADPIAVCTVLLLAGCVPAPPEASPDPTASSAPSATVSPAIPSPTAQVETVGVPLLQTTEFGVGSWREGGMPRVFTSTDEVEGWTVAEADGRGAEAVPVELRTVDLEGSVLVAEVFDACDSAVRFVAGPPGVVIVDLYDPTPVESHLCEAPTPTLVASVVGIDEVGADSPEAVRIRRESTT